MKLLFVTSRLPYPPHRGDKLKIYHLMRLLSQRHEITLLSLVNNEQEAKLALELKPFCSQIETIIHSPFQIGQNLFKNLVYPQPFQVAYFHSERYAKKLQALVQAQAFDLIHTHLIRMAPYTEDVRLPRVLDLTDAISKYLERRYYVTRNPFAKIALYIEWKRMLKYEPILEKFDAISVCSEVDRQTLAQTAPKACIEIIRNGLDLDYFKLRENHMVEPFSLIYTGNMAYPPNEDGLLYFYNEILPLIRQKIPNVRLYVVGQSPSEKIKQLAEPERVIVTGVVPDLREYYARAEVAICPVRFGAGTLNKVIEPMAMSLPVVSTSVACAGMNVRDGENILFADHPETFAKAIIKLLEDPELRLHLGSAGRQLVETEHNWEQIVEKLESIYERIRKSHVDSQ